MFYVCDVFVDDGKRVSSEPRIAHPICTTTSALSFPPPWHTLTNLVVCNAPSGSFAVFCALAFALFCAHGLFCVFLHPTTSGQKGEETLHETTHSEDSSHSQRVAMCQLCTEELDDTQGVSPVPQNSPLSLRPSATQGDGIRFYDEPSHDVGQRSFRRTVFANFRSSETFGHHIFVCLLRPIPPYKLQEQFWVSHTRMQATSW